MAECEFLISSPSTWSFDPHDFSFREYETAIRIIPALPVTYISLGDDRYGVGEDLVLTTKERDIVDTHFSKDTEVIKRPGFLKKVTIFTDHRREDAYTIDTLRYYAVADKESTRVELRFIDGVPIFPEDVNVHKAKIKTGDGVLTEYLAALKNHNDCVVETMEQLNRFLSQSEKENKMIS